MRCRFGLSFPPGNVDVSRAGYPDILRCRPSEIYVGQFVVADLDIGGGYVAAWAIAGDVSTPLLGVCAISQRGGGPSPGTRFRITGRRSPRRLSPWTLVQWATRDRTTQFHQTWTSAPLIVCPNADVRSGAGATVRTLRGDSERQPISCHADANPHERSKGKHESPIREFPYRLGLPGSSDQR